MGLHRLQTSMQIMPRYSFQELFVNNRWVWKVGSSKHRAIETNDLHRAQSNLYRRLSANIYKTKDPNIYYHTYGSLEATPILESIGLPGYKDELEDYNEICDIIQQQCKNYTAEELDQKTVDTKQAGAIVYKLEDFQRTEQGKALAEEPLFSLLELESHSKPALFPDSPINGTNTNGSLSNGNQTNGTSSKPQILTGIKVLDLSRVIAGPVISRILAEYGATVVKSNQPKASRRSLLPSRSKLWQENRRS